MHSCALSIYIPYDIAIRYRGKCVLPAQLRQPKLPSCPACQPGKPLCVYNVDPKVPNPHRKNPTHSCEVPGGPVQAGPLSEATGSSFEVEIELGRKRRGGKREGKKKGFGKEMAVWHGALPYWGVDMTVLGTRCIQAPQTRS